MTGMKTAMRLLILTLLAALPAACDSGALLRDHYMGQKLLEPALLPQRVPRDDNGNPQLQTQERELENFWRQFKFWRTGTE
jgi:hypothetical protein